jgi:hypothetical protein
VKKCPLCGEVGHKVIYMGLPLRLCTSEDCSAVWGFWVTLFLVLPFNGLFYCYDDMSYPKALWQWLFDKKEEA